MGVPVQNPDNTPAMPTKASRARRWVKEGKATEHWSDNGIYFVRLTTEQSGRKTQPVAVGIDPGKLYTGVAVQSANFTLWMAHLVLPFKTVKERMEQRAMMRRGRRRRRINRKLPYNKRAHRQARFDNRRHCKVPPSIRANRELELRVFKELLAIYPITAVVYEVVKARGDKGFSPVMVGQQWQLNNLKQYVADVQLLEGWKTAFIRRELGLQKQKYSSM